MENNYKPNKEFTDQAWSEMKALLDNEMPDKGAILLAPNQKERKSSLLLLLLLPLLLGMTALFFYYQSNDSASDEMTRPSNDTSELAILPQRGNNKAENTVLLEEVSNVSATENNQSIEKASTTNKITTPEPYKASQNSKINTKTQTAPTKTQINAPVKNEIQKLNELKSQTPFISDSDKFYKPLEEVIERNTKEEVREPIASITSISGISLNSLALIELNPDIEKFENITKLKNRLPVYGFIGARNYDFSDNIDLVANVETVIRKGNGKLGWRTGINYARRSTAYLIKEETIASGSFYDANGAFLEMANGNFESADYSEARALLHANSIKYHFLELPLFLDYKFSKKWSMHAGLSAKALIYSSSQNFGLLNGFGNRNEDDAIFLEAPIGGNPEEITSSVSLFASQKINLGASVGVNFMASERLGIQARFSQNLRDVYPDLNGKQRSNNIELGLSWRLK